MRAAARLISSGRKPGILRALDFQFVEVEFGKAYAATPARLCLWLCGAFTPERISDLHDAGSECVLSWANHAQYRFVARRGP
jgi:hypothetical protein